MELLAQFARGDLEAFEALFRQFQREVYGWIIRIVRDQRVAEDLTLETFLRIYNAHARFDPTRSFQPWARRIATNVALDYLKRLRPEVELVESISQEEPPDPASVTLPSRDDWFASAIEQPIEYRLQRSLIRSHNK